MFANCKWGGHHQYQTYRGKYSCKLLGRHVKQAGKQASELSVPRQMRILATRGKSNQLCLLPVNLGDVSKPVTEQNSTASHGYSVKKLLSPYNATLNLQSKIPSAHMCVFPPRKHFDWQQSLMNFLVFLLLQIDMNVTFCLF